MTPNSKLSSSRRQLSSTRITFNRLESPTFLLAANLPLNTPSNRSLRSRKPSPAPTPCSSSRFPAKTTSPSRTSTRYKSNLPNNCPKMSSNSGDSSPVKLTKPTSLKPYSPPQPRPALDASPVHYNASVVNPLRLPHPSEVCQPSRPTKFREPIMPRRDDSANYSEEHQKFQQSVQSVKQYSRQSQDQFNGEVSMADVQPYPGGKITHHYQEGLRGNQQLEQPSYKKSLLESNRINQNFLEQSVPIAENMIKSNSSTILPKITQSKMIAKLNANPLVGYGSVGQSQQETAMRTNSSKQTISPHNEFIQLNHQGVEDSLMRKSKTAQESMRESQALQAAQKFTYKMNSAEPHQPVEASLPLIHSPSSGTQQGFAFGQSKTGKTFLQRRPQAKIVSRLFSSKSDNNYN